MTTATPSATNLADPASGDPVPSNERTASLLSRFFFPVVGIILVIWGIIIATSDKVAKPVVDPTEEFSLDEVVWGGHWVVGHIGGTEIDLGLTKGVLYLLIAVVGCMLFALYVNRTVVKRLKQETRTQSVVEGAYEFSLAAIASSLSPNTHKRYMPYVAALFMFVWFVNMTSFVPLPLNTDHQIGDTTFLHSFGIYAVSSNIFFTVTLALCTFVIYHYEGIRAHGLVGYLKTWTAGQPMLPFGWFVFIVETLTNLLLKPLSLAVRLFANMLSGHILILLMLSLAGIVGGSIVITFVSQSAGTLIALFFYLFEMVIVATLQAYIFAVLTAIYIGTATEQH